MPRSRKRDESEDLKAFAADQDSLEELRQANDRLRREIEKVKREREDLRAAIRQAIFDAVAPIKLDLPRPHRWEPQSKAWRARTPEVAIVQASDWQLGKRTATYDSDVCARRIATFAQKVLELSEIQAAHHPVREARLYLTGDIVEGLNIFPGQAYQVDAGLFQQVAKVGPDILMRLILTLLAYFDRVHVVGVIGNHGRAGTKSAPVDPEDNMDRMLYEAVRRIFEGPPGHPTAFVKSGRLTWSIPQGPGLRNWYAVDRIGRWGHLLFHGDQIRGWAGIPLYGFGRRTPKWIDAIPVPWDVGFCGHFHTETVLTIGKRRIYTSPSPESDNEYAQETLGEVGHPMQMLRFHHPDVGLTAHYPVDLEPRPSASERYEAWRTGAPERCPTHPNYRATRAPVADCDACRRLCEARSAA